ncbi:MAG TPA: hypothetical protein VHO70_19885 [Chitinispirillaceae bacterium]|nr:hypothetical protein [Chitinispirillaceae bacterium]
MQKTKRYFPLVETENSHSKILVDYEKAEITIKKIDWRTDTADVLTFPISEISEIAKKLMEIDKLCKMEALAKAVTFSRARRKLEQNKYDLLKSIPKPRYQHAVTCWGDEAKIVKSNGIVLNIDGVKVHRPFCKHPLNDRTLTINRKGLFISPLSANYWADWMRNFRGTRVCFPYFDENYETAFLFEANTNKYLGRAPKYVPVSIQSNEEVKNG